MLEIKIPNPDKKTENYLNCYLEYGTFEKTLKNRNIQIITYDI
jgi:hypothetical protein